jgi:predicted nucleotidyltransferase component of viral defense system
MNPALKDMLEAYRPETPADYQNATREIVQEIALLGLWRGGFFEHAAFYGGTALRIFHGLRRFSEDLDFTLLDAGDDTRLERYLPGVATELES